MAINAGLVGLPNVGKSTIFNALTKSGIPAENYPFCTIDPHVAIVKVPHKRLNKLTKIFDSIKITPTTVQFVDIAGIVKGASKGEGLGNQFLSHIAEVDLILHVLRCFEDKDVMHVHSTINPIEDFEVVYVELMLKDLESVENREVKLEKLLKTASHSQTGVNQIELWKKEKEHLAKLKEALEEGSQEKIQKITAQAKKENLQTISPLSGKNFLIIANLSEEDLANKNYEQNKYYKQLVEKFGISHVIPVSAKIEAELAQLDEEDSLEMIKSLGLTEKSLDDFIKKSYRELGLITFFTCGPKESHAWSIPKGTTILEAAGEIHTDIQRGFICAEVYNCEELFEYKSEQNLKAAGKIRIESKNYIVQDGDVVFIRFNV